MISQCSKSVGYLEVGRGQGKSLQQPSCLATLGKDLLITIKMYQFIKQLLSCQETQNIFLDYQKPAAQGCSGRDSQSTMKELYLLNKKKKRKKKIVQYLTLQLVPVF